MQKNSIMRLLNLLVGAFAVYGGLISFFSVKMSILWYLLLWLVILFGSRIKITSNIAAEIIGAMFTGLFVQYFSTYLLICLLPNVREQISLYLFYIGNKPGRTLVEIPVILVFYFLVRAISKSIKKAMIIAPIPFFIFALADYYVYSFRGNELCAVDITSLGTALNVIGSYNFLDMIPLTFLIIPYGLFVMAVCRIEFPYIVQSSKRTYVIFALSILSAISSVVCMSWWGVNHVVSFWGNNGAADNGVINNFMMSFGTLKVSRPEGYSTDAIDAVGIEASVPGCRTPNIIVVMNEAFSDPTILNSFPELSADPLPFFHSFTTDYDNVVQGGAFSSVYGGNTANSEFEALTGITTGFLPKGAVPYNIYVRNSMFSVASILSEQGYTSIAMHPYPANGYRREKVYPLLGFDEMYFLYDFDYDGIDGSDAIRNYMSDKCAYENLLNVIDDHAEDKAVFAFMITMQNHGGFNDENTTHEIRDYVANDPAANVYLTLLNESDQALSYLIDRLENSDEDYILLIFGDHQPGVDSFSSDKNPGGDDWKIPFMIWSNCGLYNAQDNAIRDGNGYTSINYLMLEMLMDSGVEIPPYFEYINSIRQVIPSINAIGFYSGSEGRYVDLGEEITDQQEADALMLYRYLQYDVLFDDNDSKISSNER